MFSLILNSTVFLETLLRSYMIGISGMIVLNEIESVTLLKSSPILYKYPWRGVFCKYDDFISHSFLWRHMYS